MVAADTQPALTEARRVELILRQVDTLPTLPAVAMRLLSLTASDDSHTRDVVDLIKADPALTTRILALCKTADKGVGRRDILTVDRAVVLLGFSAVRNAVLSVKVLEMFGGAERRRGETGSRLRVPGSEDESDPGPRAPDPGTRAFDSTGFWLHSLAVAIAAEQIAEAHRQPDLPPDEAFVCGLLHDIGKLALAHALPKAYAKVVRLAHCQQVNIAQAERQLLGLDHHTAGKRLAEQWRLPHRLMDAVWLHGSPYATLPDLDHRRLIGVVTLADRLARGLHLGFSGNHSPRPDTDALTAELGLDPGRVERATAGLHDRLEQQAEAIGLCDTPSQALLLGAVQQANAALGRLNQALGRQGRDATEQARVLAAIDAFQAVATGSRSVDDTLDAVAASAHTTFGPGFYATLYPVRTHEGESWMVTQYDDRARPMRSHVMDKPYGAPDLRDLDAAAPTGLELMAVLPWLADYLMDAEDLRRVKLLPLGCGWGTAAVLIHDRPMTGGGLAPGLLPGLAPAPPDEKGVGNLFPGVGWRHLSALTATWGAAIAAASQHEGARRLGEQLAESNAALAEAQDKLLRQETMARLGELAAGAAHEMNNPLAIISGRAQLLTMTLQPGTKPQQAADTIAKEAHRLSDLISALHMFAEPPAPTRGATDLPTLVDGCIRRVRESTAHRRHAETDVEISLHLRVPHAEFPTLAVDGDHIGRAVTELLLNAVQAAPKSSVSVTLSVDDDSDPPAVRIAVEDDGDGMDERTLRHAMDPFFSAKAAGRRVGMGLPRAQQLVAAHGGEIDLDSTPGKGTVATIALPLVQWTR